MPLTWVAPCATIVRMVAAPIAALALTLCACAASAQQRVEATLTVVVKDQSGAVMPGARVFATEEASGSKFEATADAVGQAVIHLDQGIYELEVKAQGFEVLNEKEIDVKGDAHRAVSLRIGPHYQGDLGPVCDVSINTTGLPLPRNPPVERQLLEAALPMMPMQQFVMSPKRLRYRWHWF